MNKFFPQRKKISPTIYAYELTGVDTHKGLIKIGYTDRDAATRVSEQLQTSAVQYRIIFEESAMRNDGSSFTDHDIHRHLRKQGIDNPEGEWFRCSFQDLKSAFLSILNRTQNEENRTESFPMRPEQQAAVEKTSNYFIKFKAEDEDLTPHFLWNCKMRFGKTFAAYQLAKKMKWRKILILTFKPAVQSAWEEDLMSHIDFKGWQFISRSTQEDICLADMSRPIVCFGSFQDYLGKNSAGGIKVRNEWVHTTNWDCVIFDEYHYGAWRENAKDLFEAEDNREFKQALGEAMGYFDEDIMPITTGAYLYLSGTPFRAINSGEFIEEQIYNWTYSDEQKAKNDWLIAAPNPYASLPRMVMMTYQMPDSIRRVAMAGEFNEFDLNTFFLAKGNNSSAEFVYKDEVQKWLDHIRGGYTETIVSDLKLRNERPPMPFSHAPLLSVLSHTFWFLPSVAACHAMKNLLEERQNLSYHAYKVIVAAGSAAGIGVDALEPVLRAMGNPLETKTITLSCGKLTTGVSVRPWSGIFMLRNSSSPETYFQAAFRVQTPWVVKNPGGHSPNKTEIMKEECYIFDFAPDRALRQIADYSCRLNVEESNPEKKVEEFINFLPVLAYDGSSMKQIDAAGILDIAMSGTSATLLARRWESATLVNVDNVTLQRLMNSPEAMKALMSIEGFRNLNQDIETIINKSETVKKAKKEKGDDITPKEKRKLTAEEKEYKSLRRKIQEKLIKFATRVPVFMYLTDYREHSLKDVITQLEPGLFKKVTGLSLLDFELLISLNLFNSALMNDAIYKFKRYEDSSLEYIGISRGSDTGKIGLFDTVISKEN